MQIEIVTTNSTKTLNINKGDNIQSVVTAGIKDALKPQSIGAVIVVMEKREDVSPEE